MKKARIHDVLHDQTVEFTETDGDRLVAEVRLGPSGRVPRHAHLRQDEHVRVLEGSVRVRVGETERVLVEGQAIDVPRRTSHVVSNAGTEDARFRLEVRPARRMEATMRAVFAASNALARLLRRLPSGRRPLR